jgi:hypothetical protein
VKLPDARNDCPFAVHVAVGNAPAVRQTYGIPAACAESPMVRFAPTSVPTFGRALASLNSPQNTDHLVAAVTIRIWK